MGPLCDRPTNKNNNQRVEPSSLLGGNNNNVSSKKTPRQAKNKGASSSMALPKEEWDRVQAKLADRAAKCPSNKKCAQQSWNKAEGFVLEPPLRSGAIALLDAQWLVNYAFYNHPSKTRPRVLLRRQELPAEAFVSVDTLIQCSRPRDPIHIVCLSYMWQSPHHPDPKGTTLRWVAAQCQRWLAACVCPHTEALVKGVGPHTYGVFWDFGSLPQHPNSSQGQMRTPHEEALFWQGLDAMATLFAHPETHCWKLTSFPSCRQKQRRGGYYERGWPFVESCWMSLAKSDKTKVQELGATTPDPCQKHAAPLSPTQIRTQLQNVSFTNAKVDRPVVLKLYTNFFMQHFSQLHCLNYSGAGWDDNELMQLSTHILGQTPRLTTLDLSHNAFGPQGCQALADALCQAKCKLTSLDLHGTPIGTAGLAALAKVVVHTEQVDLFGCQLSDTALQALAEAAAECFETSQSLTLIELTTPTTKDRHNRPYHSERGEHSVVREVCLGRTALLELNVGDNPCLSNVGHLGALLRHCPQLTRLYLDAHWEPHDKALRTAAGAELEKVREIVYSHV